LIVAKIQGGNGNLNFPPKKYQIARMTMAEKSAKIVKSVKWRFIFKHFKGLLDFIQVLLVIVSFKIWGIDE
jgi:hypothetical protein